jgi:hypothetical protein
MSAACTPTTTSLHPHHAKELYDGSGIDPAVVASRGYRSVTAGETACLGFAPSQRRDGLLCPQWTLAGRQRGWLLKPDQPRTDDKGRILKYEAPVGSVPHFDIHPDARHLLADPSMPIYFTEGTKKSDSAWSRGLVCLALPGVWQFIHGRLVVPDLDEIALDGRLVRVVFDSDVTRKAAVAEALLRFCAALHRRGARVEVIYLPEGPDGAKVGFDDFFVAGNTVAGLEDLARPWDGTGPGIWLHEAGDEDIADLRAQRDAARDDARVLVQAIMNPDVTRAQLVAATAVASLALAKQRRGEVESDGSIALSASAIADDWRPAPAKGEHVSAFNPRTGTKPRMARGRVGAILSEAVERGLIHASAQPTVRRHRNGSTYNDTEWIVAPTPSLAAALTPWATYHPAQAKVRKPRTVAAPCPNCGEIHPVRQVDYCQGCGSVLDERTIEVPPNDSEGASDKLSEASPPTPLPPSPSGPPVLHVRRTIRGDQATPARRARLAAAPAWDTDGRTNEPPRHGADSSRDRTNLTVLPTGPQGARPRSDTTWEEL